MKYLTFVASVPEPRKSGETNDRKNNETGHAIGQDILGDDGMELPFIRFDFKKDNPVGPGCNYGSVPGDFV
jgi:hypothetical protein